MKPVNSLEHFEEIVKKDAVLFYFSYDGCNVCKVLKPKVINLIKNNFPKIEMFYIDTEKQPDIAAQNSVFTNPVILIYFDGKEFYRKARFIGIDELGGIVAKPYSLFFE